MVPLVILFGAHHHKLTTTNNTKHTLPLPYLPIPHSLVIGLKNTMNPKSKVEERRIKFEEAIVDFHHHPPHHLG